MYTINVKNTMKIAMFLHVFALNIFLKIPLKKMLDLL